MRKKKKQTLNLMMVIEMDKINPFKEILDSTKRLPDKTLLFPDQHPFIEVWFEEREYKEYSFEAGHPLLFSIKYEVIAHNFGSKSQTIIPYDKDLNLIFSLMRLDSKPIFFLNKNSKKVLISQFNGDKHHGLYRTYDEQGKIQTCKWMINGEVKFELKERKNII
jgi:hypothetical protein